MKVDGRVGEVPRNLSDLVVTTLRRPCPEECNHRPDDCLRRNHPETMGPHEHARCDSHLEIPFAIVPTRKRGSADEDRAKKVVDVSGGGV